jgi:predicted nucleotidyltransferase
MNEARRADPNLALLDAMVALLGPIANELVFIGGCATGLLVTAPRAQSVRVTHDVDVVAEATTIPQFHAIESRLRKIGFSPDPEVICRWNAAGFQLDIMPSSPAVLGFANRWYPAALASALERTLPSGRKIRHVAGPEFLATKFEAFRDRGKGDYLASHDLEDIVTVLDGREEIEVEINAAPTDLGAYVRAAIAALLRAEAFITALPAHLAGDMASQARLPGLIERMRRMVG